MAVGDKRMYPDFCVDQFWGPDNDTNLNPDVIRIVVEVGSLSDGSIRKSKTKEKIEIQLHEYMELVGGRWRGRLLGLAILGNEVYMAQKVENLTTSEGKIRRVKGVGQGKEKWVQLSNAKVGQELERVYKASMSDTGHRNR